MYAKVLAESLHHTAWAWPGKDTRMSNLKQSKEELDAVLLWRGKHAVAIKERDALQQRLTAADERVDLLEAKLINLASVARALAEPESVVRGFIESIVKAKQHSTAEGCVHEFIPFTEGCSKCGEPYTAEGASHEA